MVAKVIVHIGGGKVGSTAIQHCLFLNRTLLRQYGVAIPNQDCELADGRADQIWFFDELSKSTDPAQQLVEKIDKICADFMGVAGRSPTIVTLSAENLSALADPLRVFARLKEKYPISCVLYIRGQEEMYQAAWQQWYSKRYDTLEQWLQKTDGSFCDWDSIVSRWKAIAGDQLVVRVLDRRLRKDQNVAKDFCDLVFPQIKALTLPKFDLNRSFGSHISHLNNYMRHFFKDEHDNRLSALLHRLNIVSAQQRPSEWIFTREQLNFIRARHAPGNARLKQAYFSDLPGEELFAAVSETERTGIGIDEMNSRNIAVIAELLIKHILEIEATRQKRHEKPSILTRLGIR